MQQIFIANVAWLLMFLHMGVYIILKLCGFKMNLNRLNCGIFGFSGKGDRNILRILGMANDSRGGDGCGYFHNNDIAKGFGPTEKFEKLILAEGLELNPDATVFIGHTRKASIGTKVALENTHPFLIDESFIFAHNGGIKNIDSLAEYYDIDTEGMTVDSHIFGAIIKRTKNLDVLSRYEGYAAISYCDMAKPNTVYLYHGASKEVDTTTSSEQEERPLFILKEKDVIYWSSIKEALDFVKTKDGSIATLNTNVLFRLQNGKLFKEKVVIEREFNNCWNYNCILKEFKKPVTTHRNMNQNIPVDDYDEAWNEYARYQGGYPNNNQNSRTQKAIDAATSQLKARCLNIHTEAYPTGILDVIGVGGIPHDVLYYHKGRHYHLTADGVHELADGVFYADKDSRMCEKHDEPYINLEKGVSGEKTHFVETINFGCKRYCFFKGVMINNSLLTAFTYQLERRLDEFSDQEDVKALSGYSTYPITSTVLSDGKWWSAGKPASAQPIKPQFTDRAYYIIKGFLTKVEDTKVPGAAMETLIDCPVKKVVTPAPPSESKALLPSPFIERPQTFSSEAEQYKIHRLRIMSDAKRCIVDVDYRKSDLDKLVNQCQVIYENVRDMDLHVSFHVDNAMSEYFKDMALSCNPGMSEEKVTEQISLLLTVFYKECIELKRSIMGSFSGEDMALLKDYIIIELTNHCKINNINVREDEGGLIDVYDTPFNEKSTSQLNFFMNEKQLHDVKQEELEQLFNQIDEPTAAEQDEENVIALQDKQADDALDMVIDEYETGNYKFIANELQELDASSYAQDLAAALYSAHDYLMSSCKEICEKYKKGNKLNDILKTEKSI